MAATKITNIIVPEVFVQYVIEKTAEKSALIQSGIISPNSMFDTLAKTGGKLVNMPFWQDLTGNDEVLSDSGSLTPGAIGSGQDIAVLHMRGRAWGVNDLAKALSGDDPMSVIGNLVAAYWNRREQAMLMSILKGIFATTLSSTHVSDISQAQGSTATDVNLMGAAAVIDAANKLGDESDKLMAIIMHSTPYSRLQKLNLIDWIGVNSSGVRIEAGSKEASVNVPTFLGKRIIVDDTCPKVAGGTDGYVYTSYLFGPGAIARGEGSAPIPVETDRDSLAGEDYLIHRRHFLLHPRGVKFTSSSVAGAAPTNAELETGANWTKVYESKNCKFVSLKTNG